MATNVAAQVYEQARLRPASPAILTHERIITYGQLKVAVGIVAGHLRRSGITPGQVVGVSMSQNPLHMMTMLALAQIGAISMPLHTSVPAERRVLAAQRFGATSVVSGRTEMALPGLAFVSLAGLSFDGSVTPDTEIQQVDADAPLRIAISSGTSGDPKGMIYTHRLVNSRNRRVTAGLNPDSRVIAMDLNFTLGFNPACRTLATGACLVFPRSLASEHVQHAIVSHSVTHLMLSPAQVRGMADIYVAEGINWPSVVCLSIGGGSLPAQLFNQAQRVLTPNVFVTYGSTESSMVALATPDILARHPTSVGSICDWAKVEVVDAGDRPLPAGEIGMLRIRSEDQVAGYYRNDALNQKHFRDGWFYPGDLGRFDEEGLLYIEGRADEQLNVGGLKVNPEDVDATLATHPGVVEAGAFVLADEEGQEVLAVAVVLREGGNLGEVEAHARARLGPLAPERYFIASALPRTITGKLRRTELSTQFASHGHSS